MNIPAPGTFSVYVHFPYCEVRCTYCDFNTYVVDNLPTKAYTKAVLTELDSRRSDYEAWTLTSIYFGGGTPSLWGPSGVGKVISALCAAFPRQTEHLEITMECNPSEAKLESLAQYVDVGVERLSIGVQTLDDVLLRAVSRRHTGAEALAGLMAAREAGFRSISADLMFGLPGQTTAQFVSDLRVLAEMSVDHLSVYHLTLEPGTAMTREVRAGRLQLPDDDAQADMWEHIAPTLMPYGLKFYEVSNLARTGHESRHNSSYWLGRPYLGLGAGAHSFCPPTDWSNLNAYATRRENLKHHRNYTSHALRSASVTHGLERIERDAHLRERLFTGLRHLPGIDIDALTRELKIDAREVFAGPIDRLVDQGLVRWRGSTLSLTSKGFTYADSVASAFF